jgi:hypothetical protein
MPAVLAYTGSTMRRPTWLPIVLLAATALPSAAQLTLTLSEVDEALRTGQTRIAADRARFHAPYRITVGQAPVDYIDVITPYRRVVLAADQRAQVGDRSFGQRQAMQLLIDADGQFDFVVEFTFHPLNNFVGIPSFDVALAVGRLRVLPTSLDRQPRFGARVEGLPPPIPLPGGQIPGGGAQPVLGGTVTARFKGSDVDPNGVMELIVSEQGKELARTRVDLGRLR